MTLTLAFLTLALIAHFIAHPIRRALRTAQGHAYATRLRARLNACESVEAGAGILAFTLGAWHTWPH